MTIAEQLCHVHRVRCGWLGKVSPLHQARVGELSPTSELFEIKNQLALSALAVRDATAEALARGTTKFGPYDHPVFFLQHMLWHEGYHFALISLALRNAGAEPSEDWEKTNVWGIWRVEE